MASSDTFHGKRVPDWDDPEVRVREGARWLTKIWNRWVSVIDLSTLSIQSAGNDPLGQIARARNGGMEPSLPGFVLARRAWDFDEINLMSKYRLSDTDAVGYGFETIPSDDKRSQQIEWSALQDAWFTLVERRKIEHDRHKAKRARKAESQ